MSNALTPTDFANTGFGTYEWKLGVTTPFLETKLEEASAKGGVACKAAQDFVETFNKAKGVYVAEMETDAAKQRVATHEAMAKAQRPTTLGAIFNLKNPATLVAGSVAAAAGIGALALATFCPPAAIMLGIFALGLAVMTYLSAHNLGPMVKDAVEHEAFEKLEASDQAAIRRAGDELKKAAKKFDSVYDDVIVAPRIAKNKAEEAVAAAQRAVQERQEAATPLKMPTCQGVSCR